MTISEHELYDLYRAYVDTSRTTDQQKSLLLISLDYFEQFLHRYESDPFFRSSYTSMLVRVQRERKIKNLTEGNDSETDSHFSAAAP